MDANFDVERFIKEIQDRPSIWNQEIDNYRNRQLKEKCWLEITDMFTKGELTNDQERHEFRGKLKKLWKSLRARYSTEHRRLKNLPSGSNVAISSSTFSYYKNLNFLEKVMGLKDRSYANDDPQNLSDSEECTPTTTTKKAKIMSPEDMEYLDQFSKNQQIRLEIQKEKRLEMERRLEKEGPLHPDYRFGSCVADELMSVPEIPKVKLKADILNLIYEAKKKYGIVDKQPTTDQFQQFTSLTNQLWGIQPTISLPLPLIHKPPRPSSS